MRGANTELPDVEDAFRSEPSSRIRTPSIAVFASGPPSYWSPYLGQWLVTSYEAVEEVLRQPRVFSNFGFDTTFIGQLGTANVPRSRRSNTTFSSEA